MLHRRHRIRISRTLRGRIETIFQRLVVAFPAARDIRLDVLFHAPLHVLLAVVPGIRHQHFRLAQLLYPKVSR